jgi:DNA-binding NarL/FixJ family response regulator
MAETHLYSVVLQHHNRLFRESLAALLVNEPDIDLVGTTAYGPELVQLCNLRRPSVALFEADVPRWSNERLVSLLMPPGRAMRTVGLHQGLPAPHIIRAYEAGVSALVQYSRGLDSLLDAIRAPALLAEAARAKHGGEALTRRELEVLYLMCAGCPPKEIGVELKISPHTVDRHKRGIFAKLGVHSEAHAAGNAVRLGLLTPRAEVARRVVDSHDEARLRVRLRSPDCPIAQRARKALDAERIAVGEDQSASVEIVINTVDGRHDDDRRVVVLTSEEPGSDDVRQAMTGGATVLPASGVDSLLGPAVRLAAEGYLAVKVTHLRNGGTRGDGNRWQLTLTPREHEILDAIGRGDSTKQIARQLGISVRTVENLQGNLFRKLRVHRKSAALMVAHDLGLLEE